MNIPSYKGNLTLLSTLDEKKSSLVMGTLYLTLYVEAKCESISGHESDSCPGWAALLVRALP